MSNGSNTRAASPTMPELPSRSVVKLAGQPKERRTARALIEIPLVDVQVGGYVQMGFNFRLSHAQSIKLHQVRASLHEAGVTYDDGKLQRHIDRPHDVFGWLIAQLEIA